MKPLTKKIIWLFAIGQLGWSLMSAILTNFIEAFYQPDVIAIADGQPIFIPQGRVIFGVFTIIGGIYALGRVFDAITDPWVGNMSDSSKNPKGRRIPFMRKGAIPLAAVTILVYLAPIDHESWINGIWVLVMMLLFYLFMTIYCTPYNALIAELSKTEEDLANISTAISFTFIFGSALGYVAPTIWGMLTPVLGSRVWAIRVVFIVMAVIALVCLLIPTFTINEKDYVNVVPAEGNAFESLKKTFSNKDFRVFVGSDVCYWVGITMFQTGLLHYVTVLMQLDESWSTILYIGMTFFSVCCYVPVNKLMGKFPKKRMVIFAFCGMSLVFLITGLAGITPIPGIVSGVLVMICAALPMAILGIIPQTIVADIAMSDAITTGENHDGMFFAARTFSMKMGQSLSILLFTSLGTIGAASGLGYRIAAIAAVVFCMFGALILRFYNEDKVKGILRTERR